MADVLKQWTITTSYPVDHPGEGRYVVGATVRGPEQREPIEVVPAEQLRGAVEENEKLREALRTVDETLNGGDWDRYVPLAQQIIHATLGGR